jgi:hypothetical protein
MKVGDELTQSGALVERLIAVEPGRFTLRALYLDRRFATEIVRSDLADYRQALEADHDTARAYARRFNEDESDEALAAWMHKKGGGAMAKTTRSTMDQPVKRKREQLAFSFMAGPASAPFSAGTGAKGARKRAKLPAVPGQIPAVASPPPRAKSHLSIVRDRAGLPAAVILGGSKHGK